jgi:hypothetical protein
MAPPLFILKQNNPGNLLNCAHGLAKRKSNQTTNLKVLRAQRGWGSHN